MSFYTLQGTGKAENKKNAPPARGNDDSSVSFVGKPFHMENLENKKLLHHRN